MVVGETGSGIPSPKKKLRTPLGEGEKMFKKQKPESEWSIPRREWWKVKSRIEKVSHYMREARYRSKEGLRKLDDWNEETYKKLHGFVDDAERIFNGAKRHPRNLGISPSLYRELLSDIRSAIEYMKENISFGTKSEDFMDEEIVKHLSVANNLRQGVK